jgi:type II secretory pathway component GspD/PulD (secretin)
VAKDGETIAVGGLIDDNVNATREEVPVLGKVPGLNFFFARHMTTRSKNELIVLIRPFVLNTACEAQPASRLLLEELSIHPAIVDGDLAPLGTYSPAEPIRPNPPLNDLQKIFRTHLIVPKDF